MAKPTKWSNWLDENLVKILLITFSVLIPLYPKLPLKMINYTYIAIRMDDVFFVIIFLVFLIQLFRKKVSLATKYLPLFVVFWAGVFASALYGIYIQHTIVIKNLGFLHALRRIEYMSLFFIAFSVIKSKKDFRDVIVGLLVGLLFVNIYGLGQKFIGWPAVQTMNPEYAKGYLLYLTPEARVSSTFAGHYDLAAYLIFLIPLVLAYFILNGHVFYFILFVLSLMILVFTASRASYVAYIVSAFPFLLLNKKIRTFLAVLALTVILTFFSQNLTSRIKRTFQVKRVFVNEKTGQVIMPQTITTKELPAGNFYVNVDKKDNPDSSGSQPTMTKDEQLIVKKQILEDIRSQAKKEGKVLTKKEEEVLLSSISASLKPINTIASDISFATRLQVEWPRAIAAFQKNIILGTGPSSITEATDNDYLRWLGEFGLWGTLAFFGIIFKMTKSVYDKYRKTNKVTGYILLGYVFSVFGLMVNASYIDVFEASKVAYIFWIVSGIFAAFSQSTMKDLSAYEKK
jgi:hypothetical protein